MKILRSITMVAVIAHAISAFAASERYAFFISDLHFGPGKTDDGKWSRIEDFRWAPALNDFLAYANAVGGGRTDLVLLGDSFELWQSPLMKCAADISTVGCTDVDCNYADEDLGCTEEEAVKRIERVITKHGDEIALIRGFAMSNSNAVVIVPGNHDAALMLPGVGGAAEKAFASQRVTLARPGYWISTDRKIYADHGHQFDDLNRWNAWPDPTIKKDGGMYLRRPWGENMVQRFYNQYEEAFPIVDNFLDEKEGVDFALDQVGVGPAALAVGRFLRVFLFEQSFNQTAQALDDGKSPWDVQATRQKRPEFFVDMLLLNSRLKAPLEEAIANHQLRLDVTAMTDDEIRRVCDQKAALARDHPAVETCPIKVEHLGAVLHSIVYSPETIRRNYLLRISHDLYNYRSAPAVYVYGHTHRAVPPQTVKLGEILTGPAETVVVNDGAFQRVGTRAQVDAALKRRQESDPSTQFSDLTPDDLPDCHTFVMIAPYDKMPVPKLMHIVLPQGQSKRMVDEGVCPGTG